jgi:hypothetical protein
MAAYRFLDNESVTPAKILKPHKKALTLMDQYL